VISIAVLCGGRSKRFGSNKVLHKVNGKSIIEQVVFRLSKYSDDVFLQTSNHLSQNNEINFIKTRLYQDIQMDQGPLGGIYSALKHAKYDKVLVVAGDLVKIDSRIISELSQYMDHHIIVPKWSNGFLEPLCAIYSKTLIPVIEQQLNIGNLKISDLYRELDENHSNKFNINYLGIEERIKHEKINKDCFKNINCMDDLEDI